MTTELNNALVPWSLTGSLLFNFTISLVTTAVYHPTLTPLQRLENSLCGFVLLDVCEMLACERARQVGQPKTRLWLAKVTQNNIQELAGCIAISCTSLGEGEPWLPWRSTELAIEQHFGHIRSQFSSSQFRCRDYANASARRAWRTLTKQKQEPLRLTEQMPQHLHKAVTDDEFVEAADRALTSALRLMSVCSRCLDCGLMLSCHGLNSQGATTV